MAVSNLIVKEKYAGDGSTTSFPIPFTFIPGELSTIVVEMYDDTTKEPIPVTPGDYTLSPAGDNPTAVVFLVAPLDGTTVIVRRDVPMTQIVEYINNGPFLAEDHEKGLDRIVLMVQQLADVVGRGLQLDILDDGVVSPVLPPGVPSAVIGFNEDGDALQLYPPGDFEGPQGDQGPAGQIATVTVAGEIEYDDPTPMSVTNVGTPEVADLQFVLRVGPKGEQGESTVLITVSDQVPDDGVGSDGDLWIFLDDGNTDNGDFYQKESGTYVLKGNIRGPAGGVNTFNGRSGAVVPEADDYSADMISVSPTGDVQSVLEDLQDQINNIDPLPSQTGNTGKFLQTDGTNTSWQDIPDGLPSQTGHAGKFLTTDGTDASWVEVPPSGVVPNAEQVFSGPGTITLQDVPMQMVRISGDSDLRVVELPDGTMDAQVVYVMGKNSQYPCLIEDNGGNVMQNGDITFIYGTVIQYIWDEDSAVWMQVGR